MTKTDRLQSPNCTEKALLRARKKALLRANNIYEITNLSHSNRGHPVIWVISAVPGIPNNISIGMRPSDPKRR